MENKNISNYLKHNDFLIKSSENYPNSSKSWDLGQNGTELKKNIKKLWWKYFLNIFPNSSGYDGAIITNPLVLEASGHVENFFDWFAKCPNRECGKKNRLDMKENPSLKKENLIQNFKFICISCKKLVETKVKKYKLLFEVNLEKIENKEEKKNTEYVYLRPETCQTIFSNFSKISRKGEKKLPFAIGQIGKSFRNEITLNKGIFRTREFEQMELEFFCEEKDVEKNWSLLIHKSWSFLEKLINNKNKIKKEILKKQDRPHYSLNTIDFYFLYDFGWGEICSNSNRNNYDLLKHAQKLEKDLFAINDENEKITPIILESSFGLERLILAILEDGYELEKINEDKNREILKLNPLICPFFVAIIPLSIKDNKILELSRSIYEELKFSDRFNSIFITKTSIGKSYRSQDSIGTYFCITIDFESLKDKTVSCRNRDNMKQIRIKLSKLKYFLNNEYNKFWKNFFIF